MKVVESLKKLCTKTSGKLVIALEDFENALRDSNRMTNLENEILSLSNIQFVSAFNAIAKLICSSRKTSFADTYCDLAKTAVNLLAKGEEEKDVLYYFDKLYAKEMVGVRMCDIAPFQMECINEEHKTS